MGRPSKIWTRKGRGFFTTLHGRQIPLGTDLKKAKQRFKQLLASSTPILPGQFSVAQLVGLFLTECDRRIAKNEMSSETVKSYRSYLNRWAEACRRVRPEHLRAYHVQAWVSSHPTWNSTTSADAISRVKIWSAWCEANGYLDADRLRSARAPQRLTRDAADPDDLLKLERAIACPYFRDWFQVLYDTGCRPGELRRLEASHVDFQRSTAIVRGKTGPRLIGLTERALGILRRCSAVNPNGHVLRAPGGGEWTQSTIKYHLGKWRLVAKVPSTTVAYHLRHDLHRRWSAAGNSDLTIAAQLGHRTLQGQPRLSLLASTYAHVGAEPLAAAAQQAEQAYQPAKPKRRQGRI